MLKKLIALILLIFSLSAFAKEGLEKEYSFEGKYYSIYYYLGEGKQYIELRGEVLSGLVEDLEGFRHVKKLIRPNVNIELNLHSGGGYFKLFNSFMKAMKKACDSSESDCQITTKVSAGHECASSCIPMFMVGDNRVADVSAQFGFHQGSVIPGKMKIPNYAQGTLRRNGVNNEWLKLNKDLFSSLEITWLLPSKLNGSNIVTKISTSL